MNESEQYPYSLEYWEKAWQQVRDNSILKSSQESKPDSWTEFYDNVSDIWIDMFGSPWTLGKSVTNLFICNNLAGEGSCVLDAGCGSGVLSIPMAEKGINVTSLDQSEGMLACLESEARRRSLSNIDIQRSSWNEHVPSEKYDLAAAAFFPPVLNPHGLQQLEKLSKGYCSIILSAGKDTFAIRKDLWRKIMDEPLPPRGYQIPCLFNYLLASGRRPCIKHLSWPENLSLPLESVVRFYKNYFAIFRPKDSAPEKIIRRTLEDITHNGMVETSGRADIAVVWWNIEH